MVNGNNNRLSWTEARWTDINKVIHDEVALLRKARRDEGANLQGSARFLTLFGQQNGFVDHVVGYKVDDAQAGKPLSISAGQSLVPATIWVNFQLSREQFNDENVATALATKAAYRLALAEDHVLLHGAAAASSLDKLDVSYEYLNLQSSLFRRGLKPVGKPVLESIIDGIRQLREKNHHGEYCAIVSPDLYQEAFAPRHNTLDAPIYEIRPLLKKSGFIYSPAAPPRTGVVFSLGGRTIDLAVPVDASTELDQEEKGIAIFRVVEQIRLRVNDDTAVVSLGEADSDTSKIEAKKSA